MDEEWNQESICCSNISEIGYYFEALNQSFKFTESHVQDCLLSTRTPGALEVALVSEMCPLFHQVAAPLPHRGSNLDFPPLTSAFP